MKSHIRCLAVIGLMLACSSALAAQPLRIVAFNAEFLAAPGTKTTDIVRFRTDWARKRHCEAVAALIETLEPDILNLSEVTNAETVEYVIQLLHNKGLTSYQGYHIESDDTVTGHDVVLITRLKPDQPDGKPIRNFLSPPGDLAWREKYVVSQDGQDVERETTIRRNAVYYFTVGGRKLGFLGLHLKSNPSDPEPNAQRTAETKICRKIILNHIVAKGYLPIVLGDLNEYDPDVPDPDTTRSTKTTVLKDLKDYDPKKPGPELVNAASKVARQLDRYTETWDRNRNQIVDENDVQTMLDHILLPKELMPHVRRVVISHVNDLSLSDHYPVIVDLDLP